MPANTPHAETTPTPNMMTVNMVLSSSSSSNIIKQNVEDNSQQQKNNNSNNNNNLDVSENIFGQKSLFHLKNTH